ncbi:hypothetical protein PYW07_014876 [Mythimna separata]|uniref:BTB domain-containing protein n=1 Tax=Mythimna separata TaxID=271217 RepID=A0AAD7Z0L0_MYTSE|nr:hypothetical protein PYW07_014876 [Mythimna separata]
MDPYAASSRSTEEQKPPKPVNVSQVYKCQTNDASSLCVHELFGKLKEDGVFDIGGTYADTEPEFWFFFTTSLCHGGNHLLNLFVCYKKTGSFSIDISNSNELIQKTVPEDDIPHLVLPETMTKYTFKSMKPNKNFFIRTFCFKTLERYTQTCSLYIPVKITVNPKFVLNVNVVKSIKLQHDLSGLLTKQEITDFVLESASRKKFPTHKILLAAHSPVLRNMLKNSDLTSMFIDISDNDMDLLLQFIYTGTIKEVMKQDCLKLLEIADKFQLVQLFTLAQHVIGDQITVDNAVEMAVVAKKYKLEDLQKRVFAYIAKNPKVMETKAWNDLDDVELTKYLFRYTRSMNV